MKALSTPADAIHDSTDAPCIGVAVLGYGMMGRVHSSALRAIPHQGTRRSLNPRLVMIAGRTESAVSAAARSFGFLDYTTDWRDLVSDSRIGLFDNSAPNSMHAEPTIAAARAGKHVICEKPLGRDADEAFRIASAVAATGVHHMCGFNYRFLPAVRYAHELVTGGELGEVLHFRGAFLQDWLIDTDVANMWRLDKAAAGSGAVGDLGSHVIDLARYLVGEIDQVMGAVRTFNPQRGGKSVEVDDAFVASVGFKNGAIGTIEASRSCPGRKNAFRFEVNGSLGSIAFDLERLNELQVCDGTAGFRTILVSAPEHPFWASWWPPGFVIGWEHTFMLELDHLLGAISDKRTVAPHGATLYDGYRASEVCDAIIRSAQDRTHVSVSYRD